MDDFLEQTAVRKSQGIYTLLYVLCWIVFVVFGIVALLSLTGVDGMDPETGKLTFNFLRLIISIVCGAVAFLAFRGSDNCRVEYDYSFTNGALDISKVLNNKRRRYLCALDTKDVTRCGPAAGPVFQKTLNEPNVKIHNWFLNREAKLYFFYFIKSGVKHVAVLELNSEMVAVIRSKNYLQKGVWYNEDGTQQYGHRIS